ncbi:SIMPL domain-containing protein [Massilia horti]|uniref:DUF541 domain-containing protein n=1 Tax=Massilia horti TaxID=2562153 RepID=A0A4Y9T1J4_9BURK|nr:SIMPL domain-containing protein [Massilia horti]TFW33113.1 DUF541 domain-containing protein [Massilia horti]
MIKKIALLMALALVSTTGSASQLPDYPFIHATGNALIFAMPDIGEIDFEIVATDADPAVARAVVEERVAEVRTLVEEQGLPVDDVAVRDVRQELHKSDSPTPLYDVKCVVHLNVRDLSKWRAIAGGLVGKPNLGGFSTAFDSSERDKIEADLITQAIRDARRKGQVMAEGFGRKLGPVAGVTPGQLKNLGSVMGLVREDFTYQRSASAQQVDLKAIFEIQAMKLRQSVDVLFRFK